MMRPERGSVRFGKENSRRNCVQRYFRFSISCCCCWQLDTKFHLPWAEWGRNCCFFFICSTRFLRLHGAFSLHIPPNIFRSCDSLAATHTHILTWVYMSPSPSSSLPVSLSVCLPLVFSYHSRFFVA